MSRFRKIDLHQTFLLDYIIILSRIHSVITEGPHPHPKGEALRTPKASGASPQGKAHDEVTTQAFPVHIQKMQRKLPDIIIWLPQKITLNYSIVYQHEQ